MGHNEFLPLFFTSFASSHFDNNYNILDKISNPPSSIFLLSYLIYISSLTYKNGRTDVCLFVCLSVGGGPMEFQTPATILMKFSTHIPTCPRKFLVQIWPPPPSPPGPRGLETLKAEGHIFKMLSRLQINLGSTGYLS